MDEHALRAALADRFDPGAGELRAVVRAAGDLVDAGRYGADVGRPLTADVVVRNLADAPEDRRAGGLADRWNWWMGALAVAHDGYERFQVRRYRD